MSSNVAPLVLITVSRCCGRTRHRRDDAGRSRATRESERRTRHRSDDAFFEAAIVDTSRTTRVVSVGERVGRLFEAAIIDTSRAIRAASVGQRVIAVTLRSSGCDRRHFACDTRIQTSPDAVGERVTAVTMPLRRCDHRTSRATQRIRTSAYDERDAPS